MQLCAISSVMIATANEMVVNLPSDLYYTQNFFMSFSSSFDHMLMGSYQ